MHARDKEIANLRKTMLKLQLQNLELQQRPGPKAEDAKGADEPVPMHDEKRVTFKERVSRVVACPVDPSELETQPMEEVPPTQPSPEPCNSDVDVDVDGDEFQESPEMGGQESGHESGHQSGCESDHHESGCESGSESNKEPHEGDKEEDTDHDTDAEMEAEAEELDEDEAMAYDALKQAELEAANARRRMEELIAAKQAAKAKDTSAANLQLALGLKKAMKHISPSEISGTSSTRTPTDPAEDEGVPPMDETRINTSTQKAAWNRLDRFLKSKRGAEFPHMREMFQGAQKAAWYRVSSFHTECLFVVPFRPPYL